MTDLPELTEHHFRRALHRLGQITGSGTPPLNFAEARFVCQLHALLVQRDGGDGSGRVHLGILAILVGCTKLNVIFRRELRMRFGELVVREWLIGRPTRLVLQPEQRAGLERLIGAVRLAGPHLDPEPAETAVRALEMIDGLLFDCDEFAALAARFSLPDHAADGALPERGEGLHPIVAPPMRAFISCSMTDADRRVDELADWTRTVASILEDYGVVAFNPIGERDPLIDPFTACDPRLYDLDYAMMAYSDLAVIRVHPPATGLGVVSELASRFAVPRVLVAEPQRQITPMITGAHPTPLRVDEGAGFESRFQRTIERLLPELRRHAEGRRRGAARRRRSVGSPT